MDRDVLTRKELQTKAKELGIKANMKTADLIIAIEAMKVAETDQMKSADSCSTLNEEVVEGATVGKPAVKEIVVVEDLKCSIPRKIAMPVLKASSVTRKTNITKPSMLAHVQLKQSLKPIEKVSYAVKKSVYTLSSTEIRAPTTLIRKLAQDPVLDQLSVRKVPFDVAQSLKRTLNYKPHRGKLPEFK